MKNSKKLLLLSLSLSLSLFTVVLNAQTLCPPVTELESTVIEFDWRAQTFDMFIDENGSYQEIEIESPFWMTSSEVFPNVRHLPFQGPDYQPEDGWELLYKSFGGPSGPNGFVRYVPDPSFALYNRYSGTVRAFRFIRSPREDKNLGFVRIFHPEYNSSYSSGLFSLMTTPTNDLAHFDTDLFVEQVNEYDNSRTWLYTEFVAGFDPCVCREESFVRFQPYLIKESAISLDISGTSETTPIISAGQSASAFQSGLSFASSSLKGLNGGVMAFNSINGYYEKVAKAEEATENGDKPKTLSVLGDMIPAFFKGADGVVKLLEFFLGSKGMAVPPRITGYSTNYELVANGSITDTAVYRSNDIYTPGSAFAYEENNPNITGSVPAYNNPLGVFNLITRPVVERQRLIEPSREISLDYRYRLTEDIEYVVNTSAGFNPIPEQLFVALTLPDCEPGRVLTNLLTQPESSLLRTPWMHPVCAQDFVARQYNFEERGGAVSTGNTNPWTQGSEPEGGDPINGTGSTTNPTGGENRDFTICTPVLLQVYAVLDPVDPEAESVVFTAAFPVTIEDTRANLEPSPRTFDLTARELCNEPVFLPVSQDRLNAFCNNEYDPSFDTNLKEPEGEVESKALRAGIASTVSAYPNPFDETVTLVSKDWATNEKVTVRIFDASGRLLTTDSQYTSSSRTIVLENHFAQSTGGIYRIQTITATATSTITLIKK